MQSLRQRWICGARPAHSWTHAAATLCVVVLFLQSPSFAAAKEDWQPIDPHELAETAPQLLPGAAAEVLELKVELDDSAFPADRVHREYLRAKIYNPGQNKAHPLAQSANLQLLDDNRVWALDKIELSARLTLPDGTSKVFTKEEIKAQISAQSQMRTAGAPMIGRSWQRVLERMVTVCHAESGAILEYKIDGKEFAWSNQQYNVFTIQGHSLPIRQLKLVATGPETGDWFSRYYILHQDLARCRIEEDRKRRKVTLEAFDIPPMMEEPLSGHSYSYFALSFLSCYEGKERKFQSGDEFRFLPGDAYFPRHDTLPSNTEFDRARWWSFYPTTNEAFTSTIELDKTGVWSFYSITEFKKQQEYVERASAIRKLAQDVVGETKDPVEKARKIHQRVQTMYSTYLNELRSIKTTGHPPKAFLDGLIEFHPKTMVMGVDWSDPLILEMALLKEVGLESRLVLLPDRRISPFDQKMPARAFVPVHALQVKLDDRWVYSMPTAIKPSLPFGEIPWYCEGQVALLVKDGSEEFIPVPFSDSAKSITSNLGTFELGSDGTLTGTAKRIYTGHAAFAVRSQMMINDPVIHRRILGNKIGSDLKGAGKPVRIVDVADVNLSSMRSISGLSITSISGLDTPETPLEIEYRLVVRNFAKIAGQHLIFRPWLFHAGAPNPFSSETRTQAIYFPYALQELDLINIKLPPGIKPTFADEKSPPSGKVLRYQTTIAFDEASSTLKLRREYVRNAVTVPVSAYASLKSWHETMTRIDQQEIIALGASAVPAELPAPAASAAPAAAEQTAPDTPAVPPAS